MEVRNLIMNNFRSSALFGGLTIVFHEVRDLVINFPFKQTPNKAEDSYLRPSLLCLNWLTQSLLQVGTTYPKSA